MRCDSSAPPCPAPGADSSELLRLRQIFLAGNDLPARWSGREQFVVLDSDFECGARFLATLAAWRADSQRCARLHVVALLPQPISARALMAAAAPELRVLAGELAAQWPLLLPGLHRIFFDGGRVRLTLAVGDALALAPKLALGFDALYLAGAAAAEAPEPALLKALTRLARAGATAASASTAAAVRAALTAGGFDVQAGAGQGAAPDSTLARYAPRWRARRFDPPAAYAGERRAMVIGAGLAGAHVAAELGARGWQVDVLDAGPVPGAGASALAWGLLHPQISSDDNVLARLTRAGYFAVKRELRGADRETFQSVGVLQIADSAAEFDQWVGAARPFDLPADWAQLLDRSAATRKAGLVPRRGGWWFPGGGLIAAGRWCRQRVEQSRARVRTMAAVARLERIGADWTAFDATGSALATAPVVVVATAWAAPRLLGLAHAPLRPVRGRISLLGERDLAGLACGMTGDGYAVRGGDGWAGVGASYEWLAPGADWPGEVDAATIHAANLDRLERLFDPAPSVITTGFYDGIRAVTKDRLPLAGPIADEAVALARPELRGARLPEVPRADGLYGLFGLGSRGLSLGLLAAELLAAQIEGEPLPVEAELAAALDPARFLLGHMRKA
ncbi:MAG: FAD-dependent 5-carboxymethylaminomethyl-2-thiouridine(34) oxidoreductase MnmC [Burkholderiaceae bacterium]